MSVNGPWGSSGSPASNSKKPDGQNFFSDFWRKFNLNGPSSPAGFSPFWVVSAVLGFYLLLGFYRIQPSEQGVVLTFGRVTSASQPGLNWHIPWPIQEVLVRDVTHVNRTESGVQRAVMLRSSGINEHTMLTRDANLVEVNFSVLWTIKDLYKFLFSARQPGETIKVLSESVVREIVAQTPIALVLAEGRALINQKAQEQLQKLVDHYQLGIHIQEVMMGRIDPPSQVIDSYRDVQRAKADQERMINDAEAYRNSLIPEKRAEAAHILRKADGKKARLIAEAKSKTEPFLRVLSEYEKNPQVVRDQMTIAATADILETQEKVMLSGKGSNATQLLPFLNLGNKPREIKQKKALESPGLIKEK